MLPTAILKIHYFASSSNMRVFLFSLFWLFPWIWCSFPENAVSIDFRKFLFIPYILKPNEVHLGGKACIVCSISFPARAIDMHKRANEWRILMNNRDAFSVRNMYIYIYIRWEMSNLAEALFYFVFVFMLVHCVFALNKLLVANRIVRRREKKRTLSTI